MLTVDEVKDIVKESSLWKILSPQEQAEVIDYTLEAAGLKAENEEIVNAQAS
jgi:hypothetical protein